MALLESELYEIKAELGDNLLQVGAEPYIGVLAFYSNILQPYLQSGAVTTSTTAVTATTVATPVAITLASATGVSANAILVVDVDDRQERAMVSSVSGSVVTIALSKAHSGTYPVTVEGGESIVRDRLRKLRTIRQRLEDASDHAGIKKVDEVEFFGNQTQGGSSVFGDLVSQREYWRADLARVIGMGDRPRGGGGCVAELY